MPAGKDILHTAKTLFFMCHLRRRFTDVRDILPTAAMSANLRSVMIILDKEVPGQMVESLVKAHV
ncbi:hypothetical protein CCR75_005430 [Bremia lactucae]|uniref:Uncharacterized protein n=1 Tax=Bremia lactucae TaxID=4779 RepID=A0A976FJZ1_BRELC|nr:hypothetical protein CCR75_005430 [Bremia lactucae]